MTVYELMTLLAKQPAGAEVTVSVDESDNREIVALEELGGAIELQILWPEEDDDE